MALIGIDTNLLVRFITQDGAQAPAATRHIEGVCTKETPGFICIIVICELFWVLRQAYKYDKNSLLVIFEKLLTTIEFEVQHAGLVWRALNDYRKGSADFSDCLISHVAYEYGAGPVHTLDKKAAKGPGFLLVKT